MDRERDMEWVLDEGENTPESNDGSDRNTIELNSEELKKSARKREPGRIVAIVAIFAVLAVAGFFGVQFFTKTGIFRQPGEINFASRLSPDVQDFVAEAVGEIELEKNVMISSGTSSRYYSENDYAIGVLGLATDCIEDCGKDKNHYAAVLYDILVPVTDFYNARLSISESELLKPFRATAGDLDKECEELECEDDFSLVSVRELEPNARMLAVVNGAGEEAYYLDSFKEGAVFQYIGITGKNDEDVHAVAERIREKVSPLPTSEEVLTLAQTGVTALSRGMNAKLAQNGGDATVFAANIGKFLSGFDLTHTSNESSFSTAATANNICSDPAMVDTLVAIGLDIVELTGNHNQDCGDADAIATIDKYNELGIKVFGGGRTAEESAVPLELSEKNTKITMLGYNQSTGGATNDATPGANLYTEEKAQADIAAAKARGDFVIVDVQYYECNEYVDTNENTICDKADSAAGDQVGLFRHLVDLGADIVVGTSAHQPQTFELYGNGAIYYGLGNLFFDQSWWPGTSRSLILVHYFRDGKLLQTRIVPTIYDSSYQTKVMGTSDAESFLRRLISARP